MSVKDRQQVARASSLPTQHINNTKPKKVTHSMASHTEPGEITRRRNSTSNGVTAQYQTKTQVKSKKMELKFGMSPFKAQQFSTDSVISWKKPKKIKKEPRKTGFEPQFGTWSLRMPKNSTIESEKNKVKNTQFSTQLYDKNTDAKHKIKDWLNEGRGTPQAPLRRSVSDMREISRMPSLTLILAERQDSRISTLSERKHQETGLKILEDKKIKAVVRKCRSVTDEDCGPPLNIVIKSKLSEMQSKSLLRRSLSDLKQKSIAARNFLNLTEVKANVGKSVVIQKIDVNSTDLSDNDEQDICYNKENIVMDDKKEKDANPTDHSKQFGSILKRPGIKRMNIKHVEFLNNIGDDEEHRVRYV